MPIPSIWPCVATLAVAALYPVAGMSDVSPFKTPSDNIHCVIGLDFDTPPQLGCTIFNRSDPPALPRPHECGGAWGHLYRLDARGPVQMSCGGPGRPNTAPGVPVIPYEDMWDFGEIRCQSLTTGLVCQNVDGHGFRLSRASQIVF